MNFIREDMEQLLVMLKYLFQENDTILVQIRNRI